MDSRLHGVLCALALALLTQVPSVASETETGSGTQTNQAAQHQQHHRRGPKRIELPESEGAVARLWKPDLSVLPLPIEDGGVVLPRTGVDNYHALVVERVSADTRTAYVRYEYRHGKPSGHSTSELTAAKKTAFEIVPDPVPREHQRYLSGETWDFVLLFEGAPAAGVPVVLETSHGNRVNAVSDGEGRVSLRIPDDFPDLEEGARDRRTAEFSVSAELTNAGTAYRTQLAAEYRVNSSHWQFFGLGAAVTGIGMLAGFFVARIGRTESPRRTR